MFDKYKLIAVALSGLFANLSTKEVSGLAGNTNLFHSNHNHIIGSNYDDRKVGMNRRDFTNLVASTAAGSMVSVPTSAVADSKGGGIVTLPGGVEFPLASFGLQVYDDEKAYRLTMTALEVGYRNFFASVLAKNQKGFAKAVRDSGIPRSDLFICGSVVSNRAKGFKDAKTATTEGWKQNMKAFGVGNIDYLDQIMLDYPGPDCESIQGQWAAFEEMHAQKLTKTLAVSNFSSKQLDCLLSSSSTSTPPVVNQLPFSVAYHPPALASDTVKSNADRGVLVQAWAPLGYSLGGRFTSTMKGTCQQIGTKYGKSGAQVALRWIVQTGASFTTQSSKKEHFAEDLDIFDFTLSPEDMTTLNTLV